MNDISSIAQAALSMSQSRLHDEISLSMIKMKAEAEKAMANMLIENARRIAALSSSSSKLIDLYA